MALKILGMMLRPRSPGEVTIGFLSPPTEAELWEMYNHLAERYPVTEAERAEFEARPQPAHVLTVRRERPETPTVRNRGGGSDAFPPKRMRPDGSHF